MAKALIDMIPTGSRLAPLTEGKGQLVNPSMLSSEQRKTVDAFKPFLEAADFKNTLGGPKVIRAQHAQTYDLILCHYLKNMMEHGAASLVALAESAVEMRMAPKGVLRDLTVSGPNTGIQNFTRQVVGTLMRAFPSMLAPQLFPTVPMNGPDARIYWETGTYGTLYTSDSPNIQPGDRLDDLTKFNVNYPNKPQGDDANLVDVGLQWMLITATDKRLASEHTVQAAQDLNALNGQDLNSVLRGELQRMIAWVVDVSMIQAAIAAVPPGNVKHWDAQPAAVGGTNWAGLAPSERNEYNLTLWSTGANAVISAIATLRRSAATSSMPTWIVAGPKACEALGRCKGFVAVKQDDGGFIVQTGPIRDFGTIDAGGIRIMRYEQMPTNYMLFGRMPDGTFDPGIRFMPYQAFAFMPTLVYPRRAVVQNGCLTRFGIGTPNTATYAGSDILAEVYGLLIIDNYY